MAAFCPLRPQAGSAMHRETLARRPPCSPAVYMPVRAPRQRNANHHSSRDFARARPAETRDPGHPPRARAPSPGATMHARTCGELGSHQLPAPGTMDDGPLHFYSAQHARDATRPSPRTAPPTLLPAIEPSQSATDHAHVRPWRSPGRRCESRRALPAGRPAIFPIKGRSPFARFRVVFLLLLLLLLLLPSS